MGEDGSPAAWDEMTGLILLHGRTMWDRGRIETVLSWMRALPSAVLESSIRLRLTEAALQVLAGRPESGAHTIAAIERRGDLTPAEQIEAEVRLLLE